MKKSVSMIIATLAFQVNTAVAQGPLDIFRSNSTKTRLEKNAPSLRNHLKERKVALEAWNAIPGSELQPVTLTANVTAKTVQVYVNFVSVSSIILAIAAMRMVDRIRVLIHLQRLRQSLLQIWLTVT